MSLRTGGWRGVPDSHRYLRRIFSGFYEKENGFRDACSTADILDCTLSSGGFPVQLVCSCFSVNPFNWSPFNGDTERKEVGESDVCGIRARAILSRTASSTFSVSVSLTLSGATIVLITCLVCFIFPTSLGLGLGLIFCMAKSRSGLFCQPINADVLRCAKSVKLEFSKETGGTLWGPQHQ